MKKAVSASLVARPKKKRGVDRRRAIGRTDYEIFPINLARQQVMQDQVAREEERLIVTEEKLKCRMALCVG